MREYFLFYRSFFETIQALPPDAQVELYPALVRYALDGIEPQGLSALSQGIFSTFKIIIDRNEKQRQNGLKGGAPKGNKNARKKDSKNNPKQPTLVLEKQPKTTQKQPTPTPYNILLSNTNVLSNNIKDDIVLINKTTSSSIKDDFSVVDAGVVVEKFLKEIFKKDFVSRACTALSISEKEYNQHAQAIVAEWQVSGIENFLPENSPTQHLLNQMRIKRDSPSERKAQASASTQARVRKDAEERKRNEEQERNEVRGSVSLEEWRRSKGLAEGESILSLLHRPTEAEALAEFHTLNPN